MKPTVLVEIVLGLLPFITGYFSFRLAARSAQEQAQASQNAVDAMAYQRAREIYDDAIKNLRTDTDRLRRELTEARTDAGRVAVLRQELDDRDQTIALMRRNMDALRRSIGEPTGDR